MKLDDISDATFAQRCMEMTPSMIWDERTREIVKAQMLDEIHFMLRTLLTIRKTP